MSDVQMNFDHSSLTDVGKVRKANEDNCGDRMTTNGYVFTVCDGMGGHVGGATASKIAIDSILNFFDNPVQNIYVGINDALRYANTQVYNAALENPELKGMGTTATILLINSTDCYIGHVGDSRIYLKSAGKLNRITKDHSFVQQLVDQGLIEDADAENHPKKNQILQAIGIKPNVEPTVCEAPIQPKKGDCFLLCSDGLNGMISDNAIEELVNESDLPESCQQLINAANDAGGKDNVTSTLVAITESPYAISTFKEFNPVIGGTSTIIEERESETIKPKSKKLLYIIIGSATLIITALCIWFFTTGTNTDEKKKDGKPKIENKVDPKKVDDKEKPDDSKTKPDVSDGKPDAALGSSPEPVSNRGAATPVESVVDPTVPTVNQAIPVVDPTLPPEDEKEEGGEVDDGKD